MYLSQVTQKHVKRAAINSPNEIHPNAMQGFSNTRSATDIKRNNQNFERFLEFGRAMVLVSPPTTHMASHRVGDNKPCGETVM